jgi:hypothetical protein
MSETGSTTLLDGVIRDDPDAWLETHGSIVLKDGGVVEPGEMRVNHMQRLMNLVRDRCRELGLPCRILNLKPRQKGSTTKSGGWCYHDMRRKRTSACVIGGQYSQTTNAWEIIQHYFKKDRFKWGNEGAINTEHGEFTNGSKIVPETAQDAEAARSGTFQFLFATEVARWRKAGVKEASKILGGALKCVPLLADTVVILETTAYGASGDFYNRWLDAVDAEDFLAGKAITPGDYIRIFTPWFVFEDSAIKLTPRQKLEIQLTLDKEPWYHGEQELIATYGNSNYGGYTRLGEVVTGCDVWEQLAWRRQMIKTECKKDPEIFNEDYPHSWDTAFLKSGRRRFNSVGLKQLDAKVKQKAIIHGVLDEQRGSEGVVWRNTTDLEAWFWKWEEPRVGRHYLISADTMTGATQVAGADDPDCHGVFVIRKGYFETGRGWVPPAIVARIAPPCRWDIDILEDRIWRLARYYGGRGGCLIAPEVNADRGLIELLKLRNANIYVREVFNRTEQTKTKAYGWQTTEQTREMLIETMARAIREQGTEGEGLDCWCPHFTEEAKNFIVKDSGRSEADTGHHDDDILGGSIGLTVIASATELVEEVLARPLPPDIQRWEERQAKRDGNSQFS